MGLLKKMAGRTRRIVVADEDRCDKSPTCQHRFAGYPRKTARCIFCGEPRGK